jgi:cell division protease FtsH
MNKLGKGMNRLGKGLVFWLLLGIIVMLMYRTMGKQVLEETISYREFKEEVEKGRIEKCVIEANQITGIYIEGGRFKTVRVEDPKLIEFLDGHRVNYEGSVRSRWWGILGAWLPMLFIIALWIFFVRQMQSTGNRALAFGKSRAKLHTEKDPKITFDDVAGVDEAKEELREVIEFLKDPQKFQKLGGKIPKGILLMGPTGSGKTLLARAVAGEAGVPFFSISGSDFVEMFVGVGASRVRDLFEQGKKSAPSIIFVDEIDAVGRQRFAGLGGGHDEREQTLNQLLVEMDGFDANKGVILIAATNRPDVLDVALLRPGRFDRHIVVDNPDIKGREGILKVHTRKIVLDKEVDLKVIARSTPGFSGADLANLCNEAALLAARRNKKGAGMKELEESIDRVIAGPERKSRVISDYEKDIVAYHESGHALLSLLIPETDPLHKVSVIPRGAVALGYTLHLPLEDRYLTTKRELLGKMTVLLGGRISEDLIFQETTTGAQNDLEQVTEAAHRMVCEFGMSEKLGPLTFGKKESQVFLGRDFSKEKNYSEEITYEIDKEVRRIVDECYKRGYELLEKNRDRLVKLADTLKEKEVLDGEEVQQIVGIKKEEKGRNFGGKT